MAALMELPPAMEGFLEDTPLQNPNYLTLNRSYSAVGHTRILQADPAVLNFGGFQLGQVHRQTLRIRNVRASGTRLHILPPTTPYFKATCGNKKGLLAPGMSEEVVVEFFPQQYRYYYDCVRIHSKEENLLIPVHAYPVMNEASFPSRIDFGRCVLGEEVTRSVRMECKVPVEFEYEIVETKPNASFRVEPMRGVVPANGDVDITVSFCPVSLTTEELVIEVRIAEFNAKPTVCTIVGSGMPGAAKERLLRQTVQGEQLSANSGGGMDMALLDGTLALKEAAKTLAANRGGGVLGGGAGHGDAYTVMLQQQRLEDSKQRDCRRDGPIKADRPRPPAKTGESPVNGIYVPDTLLLTTADIAYVLNQSPSKLRTKDVKGAIDARKASLAAQKAALDAVLAEGISEGLHPLERPDIPADVKAALFRMQLHQAEEAAKRVSLGTGAHIGEDLLSEEDIRRTQQLREEQERQHQLLVEARATQRLVPELEPAGAVHVPNPAPPDGTDGGAGSGFKPEWRVIEGSDWAKRTRVLDMFQKAAWRIIYNLRLQKRLDRIKDVLNQLGRDKQRLAEEAANPVLLAMESDRPGTAPTKYLRPEMVRVRPLPLYRDVLFQQEEHVPVGSTHYTDFDELAPFKPKVPLEYKLLGYTPEEFPGLTPYQPPLLDQPLLSGAVEEVGLGSAGLVPSSVAPPLSDYTPLPDACKASPYVTLEIGNRYSEDKVVAMPEPSWGMDVEHLVQPRIYPVHDSGAHEAAASGSVRALRGAAALSDAWLPRQDAWSVKLGAAEAVPPLMAGPDPSDLFADSADDADKPRVAPKVPTQQDLAAFLPTTSRNGPSTGTAAAEGAHMEHRFRLVRQKHAEELEAKKEQAHLDAITAFESKLQTYNKDLLRPCHFALEM